jgi:hypothetical protein
LSEAKGSKRSMLELIDSTNFISSMNLMIQEEGAVVVTIDSWLPLGIKKPREGQLKEFLNANFNNQLATEFVTWWLAESTYRTPNWDFISTCKINGQKGILLIEAKAHKGELNGESHGKKLKANASKDSKSNHENVQSAIKKANDGINKAIYSVSISRDKCYQLSNRVANAWWLANQGIPVVLIYLGFLDVQEMNYGGRKILTNQLEWENCFLEHTKQVGVDKIVDKWVDCGKSRFKLICKSF